MNPILFDASEITFDSNGLGVLSDAISCTVTEERNGAFELTLEYPISGIHYEEITNRRIIYCKPNPYASPQPFRIYRMTKPLSGRVTVYAEHISYDLSGIPVSPFTAASASAAMLQIENSAAVDSNFTFWTDKETAAAMTVEVPSSTRSILGGNAGSVLDVYGGEYEWDRWTVRLWSARGADNGVIIRYGKNLTDLEQDENISNVATGVYPYWKDSDGNLVELPEKIVDAPGTYNFTRIIPLDLSSDFEEQPTVEQLRERAEKNVDDNDIGIPTVSISVAFQPLDQTEEYKDLALLERVGLCDTVTVQYETLGVSAKAKCVKTEYDALLDRYTSIELGDARTNIADTIYDQGKEIQELPESSAFLNAVNNATNWITNGRGYMVAVKDENGNWMETVSLDTPDIKTAQNVWRWNNGGFGHSSSGYNGPYDTAITQDGAIVANFITAGQMSANVIKSGILVGLNNPTVYFNLDTGEIAASNLVSASYPNYKVFVGPSEQSASYAALTIQDQLNENILSVYRIGIAGNDDGAVITCPLVTNVAENNRKGISFQSDKIILFADYGGGANGVEVDSSTGITRVFGKGLNVIAPSTFNQSATFNYNINIASTYRYIAGGVGDDLIIASRYGISLTNTTITLANFSGSEIIFYKNLNMSGNSILNQSDIKLKENVRDTDVKALEKINAIEHKQFDWKETGSHQAIGYVAQQIQEIIPELVHEGEDGVLFIKQLEIIPYLSKAIQELSARIDELERKVNADGNQ